MGREGKGRVHLFMILNFLGGGREGMVLLGGRGEVL